MNVSDPDALLAEWLGVIDSLGEVEFDSGWEWRGETDGSGPSYLRDKEELQAEAEEALVRALRVGAVRPDVLLARARELCEERKEQGYWGTDRCLDSVENAEREVGELLDGPSPEQREEDSSKEPTWKLILREIMDLTIGTWKAGWEQGEARPSEHQPKETRSGRSSSPGPSGPYRVYISENSRYADDEGRYFKAAYPDCETALQVCRDIVDTFLQRAFSKGKSEDELWDQYVHFGEDPHIVVAGRESDCSFSAWDYARQRIRELAGEPNT